jgi:hypothetical protein
MHIWSGYCEGVWITKTHNAWVIKGYMYMGYTKREAVRLHKREKR